MRMPEIKDHNNIPTLYVNDEPFLVMGGEIHNSGASSLDYMREKVWPNLKGLNMNTLIVPVYWETVEPVEGQYDFTLPDGLISQARENGMHLIFLWFGLWKNGESMYVPIWMKKDTTTYFRAKKVNGDVCNTISPFCEAAIEKDAAAFATVLEHIKELDEDESTVIMMQVENEIGLLGTDRDYGAAANATFENQIPDILAEAYQVRGTWKQVFGEDAAESFMAYYFAKAVEIIAAAGKKKYALPCYTNAWIRQYPWKAGTYPSGGPVREMHRIWKAVAPSLFTLAPDIYVPYVAEVMNEYGYEENPLFVPEVRKDAVTASYCMYAFGGKYAIGYSPFGIEELTLPPENIDQPPMEVMMALNIDPSAFEITGSKDYLSRTYELIDRMKPLYLKYRGTGHLKSYIKKCDTDYGVFFRFESYDIQIAYAPRTAGKTLAAGMVYELEEDKFLLVGMMSTFTFFSKPDENLTAGILRMEEGEITDGEWKQKRILNGDEQMMIKVDDMPSCYLIELYKY